ncbi:MAG: hypothetical protein LQ352_002040 [Teloschistes flavicans]|nr:MAG: hypothetical protein LQ352_002040 [Teloschistes flavicans]
MSALSEALESFTSTFRSLLPSSEPPTVYPTLPTWDLLRIWPTTLLHHDPRALPPPVSDATFARPFNVSDETYNNALSIAWPVIIALVYAVIAKYFDNRNKARDNRPWSFSKTSLFYTLVLLHNLFLAIYSAWTCLGMINAIKQTLPGWEGEHKLARTVDGLCKLHGPRGYGSAASFSLTDYAWKLTDRTMKLDRDLPDTTDVGRLWNEGLAFYGWLFYLSKFYEIVDTFIILVKGKNTSTLQTFHHAGAMFCTWAGIRFMSPPIWMFVIVNSGIHTLMYTYYTLNHLGIHVSQRLKSTLTRLQIVQFVFGATYAMAHLFIAYDIPVETPYLFVHNLSSAIPTAASAVSSTIASATASADIGAWLKKAALRAAGEEGLAENVRNSQGQAFGIDAVHAAEVERAQEIRYKMQYQRINCLDTPGETFAILLNFVYLAPLTYMFIGFFVKKYRENAQSSSPPSTTENVQESGKSAVKDLRKDLADAMSTEQNDLEAPLPEVPAEVSSRTEIFNKGTKDLNQKAKDTASWAAEQAKEKGSQANDILQEKLQAATDAASEKVNEMNKKAKGAKDEASRSDNVKDEPAESKDAKSPSNDAPKLDPPSSSSDNKKPQSRSQSPQKKTQLPRPQSRNRQPSPGKKDSNSKEEEKARTNGAKDKPSSLDESAYEVNPDELKDEGEVKAEKEMQPKSE